MLETELNLFANKQIQNGIKGMRENPPKTREERNDAISALGESVIDKLKYAFTGVGGYE
jgi:hypothetical protein